MSKQTEKNLDVDTTSNVVSKTESCFIITPIGALDSETFKKTTGLISSILSPVLKEFNFKAVPAYEIPNSGSINRQILKSIISDKLVIANLTGLNPNVMYELAVRHAVRLPIIIMAEHGTNLPFDITDQRTIFYHDTLLGAEEAKPKLRIAIEAALADKVIDNPIYQVVEEATIIKAEQGQEQSINEYLIRRFDQLESNINGLNQKTQNPRSYNLNLTKIPSSKIEISFIDNSLDIKERSSIINSIINGRLKTYYVKGPIDLVSIITSEDFTIDKFYEILADFKSNDKIEVVSWAF